MNPGYMGIGSDPELLWTESSRLRTFSNWTSSAVRPEDLAKAGFVYVEDDKVQCVYCKGILGSWVAGDVPLEEHRKFFPFCPLFTSNTPSERLLPGIDVAGTGRPPKSSPTRKKSVILNKNVIPHHSSKHPEFFTLESRLQSFESWPVDDVNLPQNIECMAEAGFFYTGATDYVTCFHCGQGLKEWEKNDDPWEEHARWHPTCELILLKKGQVYVENAKRKLSAATEIKDNEFLRKERHPVENEREIVSQPNSPRLANIAVKLIKKVGFKTSPRASNDEGSSVEKDEMTEQEFRSCIVCTDQERCVTFLPCGHFSTCADCTLMLSDCPVCRQPIETVVKTYMT